LYLDCSATAFIDSSGIGALVSLLKASREQDVELVLTEVHPAVMAILELTSLNHVFTIQPSGAGAPFQAKVDPTQAAHPAVRSRTKRLLDIAGALVGLTGTGLLLPVIALAIRLDDPGPIFFRQTRCGWMGRRFRLYKFRSMIADAERLKHTVPNEVSGALFKNANDPRITRVGRLLRRTSLDELPQFWNVLRGDMSLVGTRPPTPDEVAEYAVPEWQRLDVKPGITGEWQVNGRSEITDFQEVIALDLRYQRQWSLAYDLRLLLRTIRVVFTGKSGAR
jgi:lipopolysaccharide/colanic/teichoic acid biosynthesis glycosyltransferase